MHAVQCYDMVIIDYVINVDLDNTQVCIRAMFPPPPPPKSFVLISWTWLLRKAGMHDKLTTYSYMD